MIEATVQYRVLLNGRHSGETFGSKDEAMTHAQQFIGLTPVQIQMRVVEIHSFPWQAAKV